MEQYNDKIILYKITDYKFTFKDLNPKRFSVLQQNQGMYCPFHESSHTGTLHARLKYDEDTNLWIIYCFVCQRAYRAHDYLEKIMIEQRKLYPNIKAFLLSKMDKNEFINLYTLFKKRKDEYMDSLYKRKCEWIDNVYTETGNTVDYIEALYTAD